MERLIPPQSIESEMSVLGAVFLENACMSKVSGMVDALDFYREGHRKIYRAMLDLHRKHEPIDLVTLSNRMKESGELEEIGGGAYLATLVGYVPTAANVHYYCKIVKEKSAARKMIEYAANLTAKAYEGDALVDTFAEAKTGLAEITGDLDGLNGISSSDFLTFDRRRELYATYTKRLHKARFVTGFDCVDKHLRGVAPGEVLTIAAYSGTFKTAFLQNLLLNGAERSGVYHLLFSLEMPVEKLYEREMQIQSGVTGWDVERHYSQKWESSSVQAGELRQGARGLLVVDKPSLTLEQIGRYAELAKQKYGAVAAIGIDYLGLIRAPGKNIYEKTAYVAIETKNMAKALRIPVILLSQVNRSSVQAGGDIETHSAKGGGDIEAAADFMLGLQLEKQGDLTLKILKNRNGAAGAKFLVDIDRASLTFKGLSLDERKTQTEKTIPF